MGVAQQEALKLIMGTLNAIWDRRDFYEKIGRIRRLNQDFLPTQLQRIPDLSPEQGQKNKQLASG